MTLYLIVAADLNGENADWFVRTSNPQEALDLYRQYQRQEWEREPLDYYVNNVFQVPDHDGVAGVLDWGSITSFIRGVS